LVQKPEGKRPLQTLTHRWEYNTRMSLGEIGWEVVDQMYLDQDRDQWQNLPNTVMNLQIP